MISITALEPNITTVLVTWDLTDNCDVTSNISVAWEVEGGESKSEKVDPSETSYTIESLPPCTEINVTVTPVDSAGASFQEVSNTTETLDEGKTGQIGSQLQNRER